MDLELRERQNRAAAPVALFKRTPHGYPLIFLLSRQFRAGLFSSIGHAQRNFMRRLLSPSMLTVIFFAGSWPFPTQAVSFDCTKARTAVERTICRNTQLSELDSLLNAVYRQEFSKAHDANMLKAQQRAWLRETRDRCKDATCLLNVYTARLAALSGVCELFGMSLTTNREELKKLSVEHYLGEVCNPKYTYCGKPSITLKELSEMGLASDDNVLKGLLHGQSLLSASLVDIDNDGVEELRLYITGGKAHCTSSYFFKKTSAGKFMALVSDEYKNLHGEGRFCGGADLSFVRLRHDGMIYVIGIPGHSYNGVDAVWLGTAIGLRGICAW